MALISQALAGSGDLAKQGSQFAIAGSLPGEQTGARLVLGKSSGLLVWQDNGIDGSGRGIAAAMVDGTTLRSQSSLLVNQTKNGDQESPDVALLANGNSLVVWRNAAAGQPEVWGRVVGSNGAMLGNEFRISGANSTECVTPSVAAMADGSAVVTWAQREARSVMLDVYLQRVSASGHLLGEQTLAHQYSDLHQRTPAVTGLSGGGFAVAWVSEEQSGSESIDIYARVFNASGLALDSEFRVNSSLDVCANPVISPMKNGGFIAAWSTLDSTVNPSWDVAARTFSATGSALNATTRANVFVKGRQYRPRIATTATGPLLVWTSFGQDGWDEGVYARRFDDSGTPVGDEIQVNTVWEGNQTEPAVASDGSESALVVWSTYASSSASFDLSAQVLGAAAGELPALQSPFVYSTSPTRLNATWSKPEGLNVTKYEVYLDDGTAAELTSNNFWASKALVPSSVHTVRIGYQLADGRRGPSSVSVEAFTWGEDANGDGLPDDWQTLYFGSDSNNWPVVSADTDGDGISDRSEFLAGTNPRNASSSLHVGVQARSGQTHLVWSTQPGFLYQLQRSPDLKSWQDLEGARVAPSTEDSLPIQETTTFGFYRVIRVR